MAAYSLAAQAAPEVGWWWNADESGRGFFVESQNGLIYVAGYFYESDGHASWLVSGGANDDPYRYDGRLLAYTGGQTLLGDYRPPLPSSDAGALSLRFSDDTHGTLVWPGGTIAIERHRFGSGAPAFPADSGWWWNEAESGRGYSLEVQGDKLFVVSFMYDDAGRAVWYFSAGAMQSPTSYAGPWLQFSGGQTMSGSYRPPVDPVTVGRLALEFVANDEAEITLSPLLSATAGVRPAAGPKFIRIGREFKPKPYALADRYDGNFSQTIELTSNATGGELHTTTTITGNLTWTSDSMALVTPPYPLPPRFQSGRWERYLPLEGTVRVDYTMDLRGPGAVCRATGHAEVPFVTPSDPYGGGSVLHVSERAIYVGRIRKHQILYPVTGECVVDGLTTPLNVDNVTDLDIELGTRLIVYGVTGENKPAQVATGTKAWSNWSFAAVRALGTGDLARAAAGELSRP